MIALSEVDEQIGTLMNRLKEADLYEEVNIVVLGDHGMAPTSKDRVEFIDDYINLDDVWPIELSAIGFLDVKDSSNVASTLDKLNEMSHVKWYTPNSLPKKWHYSGNERITDLIGVVDVGWHVTSRERYERNPDYYTGGNHGYDPSDPTMHAGFVARGPQFEENLQVEGFSLIHIYELLCAALNLTPADNDGDLGTVRHLLREVP